jgi:hypothetical protein
MNQRRLNVYLDGDAGCIKNLQRGRHSQYADEVLCEQRDQQRVLPIRKPRWGCRLQGHARRVDCAHNA